MRSAANMPRCLDSLRRLRMTQRNDYPAFAKPASVGSASPCRAGLLVCNERLGICITLATKVPAGAPGWPETWRRPRSCRRHNDSNGICLSASGRPFEGPKNSRGFMAAKLKCGQSNEGAVD